MCFYVQSHAICTWLTYVLGVWIIHCYVTAIKGRFGGKNLIKIIIDKSVTFDKLNCNLVYPLDG